MEFERFVDTNVPDYNADSPIYCSLLLRYSAEICLYKPWRPKEFFQFEIIINVLVGSFRFI